MMFLQLHLAFGRTCVVFVWIVGSDLLFAANTQTELQNIFVQITEFICVVFVWIVGSDLLFAANTQTKLGLPLSQDERRGV